MRRASSSLSLVAQSLPGSVAEEAEVETQAQGRQRNNQGEGYSSKGKVRRV